MPIISECPGCRYTGRGRTDESSRWIELFGSTSAVARNAAAVTAPRLLRARDSIQRQSTDAGATLHAAAGADAGEKFQEEKKKRTPCVADLGPSCC